MRINKFIIRYIEEKVKDKKNLDIIGLTKRESKNVIRLLEEQQQGIKGMFYICLISYFIALLFGVLALIQMIR